MISIALSTNAGRIASQLGAFSPRLLTKLKEATDLQNELTVGHIQRDLLTGQVLHVRTNRLRGSIRRSDARIVGSSIVSSIGSNVVYAAIHEFGGQTKPHKIEAKNGKALRFGGPDSPVFRRFVNHPGSKIPARSYIRRGIQEREKNYSQSFSRVIVNEGKELGL